MNRKPRLYNALPVRFAVRSIWTVALCLSMGAAGCLNTPVGSTQDGNVSPDPSKIQGRRVSGEPNDSFSQSLDLIFDANGIGRIQGSINPASDVDVYNLGSMMPGDRIRVDLQGSGGVDLAIALFDEGGELFITNDDRDVNSNQLDPFVNEVVRHAGLNYFLAVGSSAFAPSTGYYSGTVTVSRGEAVPVPRAQAVLLNYAGGTVTIPGDRTYTVGAFNAADIDARYAGQTDTVKRWIFQTVEGCFNGIALDVYDTDSHRPRAGTAVSTVYFGGRNRNAYGISQDIDEYNRNPTDAAIIFTNNFTADQFNGRWLTAAELGVAIGHVAAHEIGHLVGLNHVANWVDVMDSTGSATTFLYDQRFQTSPLDPSIWPFGNQDGWQLLLETLGLESSS